MGDLALLLIAGYLLGSINVAILLFRWQGKGDPRSRHSGNPGVSNVYRQAGPLWAGAVLLAEGVKSAALGWLALKFLAYPQMPWVALSLLVGNRWPCLHQFRGGKGVANFLGFNLPINFPVVILLGLAGYLAVLAWRRTAFLASFALVLALFWGLALKVGLHLSGLCGLALCALLITASHGANIRSLIP
ncbi:MAG: glycerol-3-phosphate acyltransferase [Desulfobacterales bacterium]